MEELKKIAAHEAVKEIKDGMIVGLGTGSTAKYAIIKLGEMVKEGIEIVGIATSLRSEKLAKEVGIKVADINEYEEIDITIDGADQVDTKKNLIKGGGGALLREKIVASCSKKEIIVVDESKLVENFSFPLPVEVVKFGWRHTADKLSKLNFEPKLRENFVTDNGNIILDCSYDRLSPNFSEMEKEINAIAGVVENGLFIGLADEIIVGTKEGVKRIL
ncbi:MAG: ribose-5-phosphate isomerase RpiA [Thermoplasmata archaeon]|nr:MAG: ribose-5-phosphate isomerase RpiA [Thermoplasmata archaeon]KAA0013337.1 MAG: ribose-5-phosphate isomerase RpiA [Thermoplasmata archaeon]